MSAGEGPRTYGGWRTRRGFGVGRLDGRQTAAGIAALVAGLVAVMVSERAALVVLPLLALAVLSVTATVGGEPLADAAGRAAAWLRASRSGWTSHRAGRGRPAGAEWTLPGPLASTVLIDAADAHGQPWAVVWDRRSGRLTATLLVAPASTWLVEREQSDAWVANWHAQLAKLGYAPSVRHLAVTVETRPAPPGALAAVLRPRLDPAAPAAALEVMQGLLGAAPAAAAEVSTRVSVTVDPAASAVRLPGLAEQVAEFSRLLEGIAATLGSCGVAVLRRAGAAETAGWVRDAFQPDCADGPAPASWADAGPLAAEELWDRYRSDGGTSVSWGWSEAPRQAVAADVLARLIAPGPHPKRVTLLITPVPAAAAARQVESQAQAAVFRAQVRSRSGREETARDLADREQAMRAAAEEARGAGLVEMQLYATATVADEGDLPAAVADVQARAEESRIQLKRLYGGQAAGFAAGLSAGVKPDLLRGGR